MAVSTLEWMERERTITERGVVLPFTLPATSWREERSGEAFVEAELLFDLVDTAGFIGPMLIISDEEVEQALVEAGWIHQTARGGVYATAEFRAIMEGETG